MKNKHEIFIILILLISLLAFLSILPKNKIVENVSDKETIDYLSINDDDKMLKNECCPQTDKIYQELISTELKGFLLNDYYPSYSHIYTYPYKEINFNCPLEDSELFSEEVDLNEDGKKEYLLMPYRICDTYMRGASGNGDILIVRDINDDFEVFGNLYGNSYFISKNKTNEYFDILTNSHGSAATGTETLYKYQIHSFGIEGKAYEEAFSKHYDLSRIEKKVIEIVTDLPEVKDFLSRMKQANQKTFIKAERTRNSWNVQVAEDHPTHTATFNWYIIQTDTMKVKCSFAIYDKGGKLVRSSDSKEYPCD